MANTWERHNHRNPCPVCGETKKGCRTNTDTNITHCRGDNPSSDYRFIKEDKHGFGMYKLEAEISEFSEAKKQEWLEERKAQRERWLEQENQKIESSLTNQERDRAIKVILSQLSLNTEDKERLKARGLTDDQIKEAGYRSVEQWQKLDDVVSPALAGVNRYGKGLNNPVDGVLVPIPNVDGEYVALRLYDPNAKETGNPKYPWLSSSKQGCTQKDKETGEYPIAVYIPSTIREQGKVGLCEGLEWKPKLAAERLGYPVIGFAGASFFYQSPQLLKEALKKLEAQELIFVPDGGAVINPRVSEPASELFKQVNELGYNINVAWWGQNTKQDGDIDEISQDTEINLITGFEFIAKAKKEQRDRFVADNSPTTDKEKVEILTKLTQIDKTINRKYFDPSDLDDMPEGCGLVFIVGHQGTGKSVLAKQQALTSIKNGKASFGITHRRLLSRSMARAWKIPYVEDKKGVFNTHGFTFVINSMHLESQAKFSPDDERLKGATVFFDEFDQVLDAAFNDSTMEDKRCLILQNLVNTIDRVVASGGKCIFASADLYDYHRDFIQKIFTQKYGYAPKVWTLKNNYNPVAENECELIFYDDPEADKTPAGIYADVVRAIEEENKIFLQSSSQKVTSPYGTRTIEADLNKRFPNLNILRCDSQTNQDPNHEAFGIAEKLAKKPDFLDKYDVVVGSPVLEVGVSADDPNGHFDINAIIMNSGDQDTRAIKQTLRRVRPLIPRWVYVTPRSNRKVGSGSTSPKGIIRDTHKQIQKLKGQLISVGVTCGDFNSETLFLKPWAMSAALKNIDWSNYRDRAREALEDVGYLIICTQAENRLSYSVGYEATKDRLKNQRDTNQEKHFNEVLSASSPDDERYQQLKAKNEKSKPEQLAQEKGFISRAYGIEPTYDLVEKHNTDPAWLQKLKLHYHLTIGKDHLSEKEKKQLESLSEGTGEIFAPEAVKRSRLLRIYWLKEFGIDLFLDGSADFSEGKTTDKTITEAELNAWYQSVLERDRELKKVLGISVWGKTKDGYELIQPKTLADRFLKLIDMSLTTHRKRDGNSEFINEYRPTRIAKQKERKLLTLKADIFQAWLSKDKEAQESENNHQTSGGDQKFPYIYTNNSGIFDQEVTTQPTEKLRKDVLEFAEFMNITEIDVSQRLESLKNTITNWGEQIIPILQGAVSDPTILEALTG